MNAHGNQMNVVFVTYTDEATEEYEEMLKWWVEWDANRKVKPKRRKTMR